MMFEAFCAKFHTDPTAAKPNGVQLRKPSVDSELDGFFSLLGGKSFNHGIYRVILPDSAATWNELVVDAFPDFANRITCFSYDWLGRVFALDSAREESGHPAVVMFEPGAAEALEIPSNLENFHNDELVHHGAEILAEDFYQTWLARTNQAPDFVHCVGYKQPLFLGGADAVENLELADIDVYWSICAQLIAKTRGLPLGTKIGNVSIT